MEQILLYLRNNLLSLNIMMILNKKLNMKLFGFIRGINWNSDEFKVFLEE